MKFLERAEKVRYLCFLLFTLNIFLMGSDVRFGVMGVNTRKLLLAFFGVISIYIYVRKPHEQRKLNFVRVSSLLFFIFTWVIFIPEFTHGIIAYSIADSLPLLALSVFLLTTDFSKRKNEWWKIRKLVYLLTLALVLLHLVLFGISRINSALAISIGNMLTGIWGIEGSVTSQFVYLNPLTDGTLRVYLGSSFFLLLGLYFFSQKYQPAMMKRRIYRFIFLLMVLMAIWSTDTRSFMLGTLVFIICSILFRKWIRRAQRSTETIALLLAAPFLLSFFFLLAVDPQILVILGTVRAVSDNIRVEQVWPLFYAFLSHPIWGQGFGASVSFIRLAGAPYAYELSILALFMKIGIAGFSIACLVLSSSMNSATSYEVRNFPRSVVPLYCLYFSYVISCIFNPYMSSLFGTFFAMFLLYEYVFLMESFENDQRLHRHL